MKLHDLKPPAGARTERTRVGRGIAAGQGKTAGRGTKGQKARAGASIPAWFEGGQTPVHIRVPKLRGFKNRFKIDYQVVNVGRISDYAIQGRFAEAEEALLAAAGAGDPSGDRAGTTPPDAPLTVNAELLRAAGLISNVRRPVKVLGQGEVGRKLFVLADAFTQGAREKIEAAGGIAQVLVIPTEPLDAIGVEGDADTAPARADDVAATDEPGGDAIEEPAAEATPDDTVEVTYRRDGVDTDPADAAPSPVEPGSADEGGSQRRGRKTRGS